MFANLRILIEYECNSNTLLKIELQGDKGTRNVYVRSPQGLGTDITETIYLNPSIN